MPTVDTLSALRSFLPSRTPTYLVFAVTSRCNADCRICFYWEGLNRSCDELRLDEIEKISRSFGYVSNLVISGGEPFLRDDLDKICGIFYKNNRTRFFDIPTNGILTDKIGATAENILDRCKKATVSLELSLDGVGPTHDFIRGGAGIFDRVNATLRRLREVKRRHKNLWLKVNTTFCHYNQDQMGEITGYVRRMEDIDDHSVSLIWGKPRDPEAKDVCLNKYGKAVDALESARNPRRWNVLDRVVATVRQLVNSEVLRAAQEGVLVSPCSALRRIVFINEEGDVYPCGSIAERIGGLREHQYDIKRILNSAKRHDLQEKYGISTRCACHWDCALFNNVVYDWKNIPRIAWHLLKGGR